MQEDIEAEMKRLRLELKQTMDMYSTACREALVAKQKVRVSLYHIYCDTTYIVEVPHYIWKYFNMLVYMDIFKDKYSITYSKQ